MITDKQTKRMKRPNKLDPYLLELLKDPRFLKISDDILTRPCCSFEALCAVQDFVTHNVKPHQFTDNALDLLEDLGNMAYETKEDHEKAMYRICRDYASYATLFLLSGVLIGVLFAEDKTPPPVSKTSSATP